MAIEPEPGLDHWQIKASDIAPTVQRLGQHPAVQLENLGKSYQGRPIQALQLGVGERRVLMWTQMHGDEPTATAAVLDLLAHLLAPEQAARWAGLQNKITLRVIPMLNPDGAEIFQRQNAQGIDINRDARALQTPEGRLLMAEAKRFRPHVGFNLHDQDRRYAVAGSGKPATISVLAPAYDPAKSVNDSRRAAMQLIAHLMQTMPAPMQQHVGRYDDTYSARAFGDNLAALGISTILIESGGYPDDPNRQVARALNAQMLLEALDAIAHQTYRDVNPDSYWAIPENREQGVFDLLLTQLTVKGHPSYQIDMGIQQALYSDGDARIADVGDLSPYAGYQSLQLGGAEYDAGRPFALTDSLVLDDAAYARLLREGYSHFVGDAGLLSNNSEWPVLTLPHPLADNQLPRRRMPAWFLVRKNNRVLGAVLNGQWIALQETSS